MNARFEELDWQQTSLGEITLRRRLEPTLKIDVYEVLLGEEFLMSSLFTVAEVALATLGLAPLAGTDLDVVVGGLGLGYTARAVLEDPRVRSVAVVETLGEVVGWHERALLPGAAEMTGDPRCRLVHGDFFAMVASDAPLVAASDGDSAPVRHHAILVDIDHTPTHLLHPSHAGFYTSDGLRRVAVRLRPGGVFGLWSDAPPEPAFLDVLSEVFPTVAAHVVPFPNHYTGGESTNTVYVAQVAAS